MKILYSIVLFISTFTYAQTAKIIELKRKAKTAYLTTDDTTIIYPVILLKNTAVAKKINDEIKTVILGEDTSRLEIQRALEELLDESVSDLLYEITLNNKILSINIYQQGCGAYCSSWYTYFNFDLKTGQKLEIKDVIVDNKIDSFKSIVFKDKVAFLTKYKQEQREKLIRNETDSGTYNWAMETVESDCISKVSIEDFSLFGGNIKIYDWCEFPHAIRSQEPLGDFPYNYKRLFYFLKPEIRKVLVK